MLSTIRFTLTRNTETGLTSLSSDSGTDDTELPQVTMHDAVTDALDVLLVLVTALRMMAGDNIDIFEED